MIAYADGYRSACSPGRNYETDAGGGEADDRGCNASTALLAESYPRDGCAVRGEVASGDGNLSADRGGRGTERVDDRWRSILKSDILGSR